MHSYTLNPATIHPRKDRILVRRYVRPEVFGSVIIPESARVEPTWNYWEVIKAGPDVEKRLSCKSGFGRELAEGDIIKTPFRPAAYAGRADDGTDLFFVPVEVEADPDGRGMRKVLNVVGIIPKTWED